MKLDKINKKILLELRKNSRIPETQLAKKVYKSKESVRYRIKQLEKEKIITGYSVFVDFSNLGYISGKLYLNLKHNIKRKKELIEFVKNDHRVFWLGVAEGNWDMGLTYFIKSNKEFYDLKNQLSTLFEDIIVNMRLATLVNVKIGDWVFLDEREKEWINFFTFDKLNEIDEIDLQIINELFNNSRQSFVKIANKLNSSIDKVRIRIKKLIKEKIIKGFFAKIDLTKINYNLFKVFLYLNTISKELELKFLEYCKQNKNIYGYVQSISSWDVELEIICENYEYYLEIMSDLSYKFDNLIQKTEFAIVKEDYLFPSGQIKIN